MTQAWRPLSLRERLPEAKYLNTTHTQAAEGTNTFLNLVDFKWLMAGAGWWVNLSRLQRDRAYADECLQRALKSDSELLRERGTELLGLRLHWDAYCGTTVLCPSTDSAL